MLHKLEFCWCGRWHAALADIETQLKDTEKRSVNMLQHLTGKYGSDCGCETCSPTYDRT